LEVSRDLDFEGLGHGDPKLMTDPIALGELGLQLDNFVLDVLPLLGCIHGRALTHQLDLDFKDRDNSLKQVVINLEEIKTEVELVIGAGLLKWH